MGDELCPRFYELGRRTTARTTDDACQSVNRAFAVGNAPDAVGDSPPMD
jgi:hypothetical protein